MKAVTANHEYLMLARIYGNDFVLLILRLRGLDVDRFIRLMADGYVSGMALDTLIEVALAGMRRTGHRI